MSKKKLAIISSYKEDCGNASYTEALRKELVKYYDVDIFSLQLDLLQSNQQKLVILGNKQIFDICRQLKDYDYVNIQFEAGLYGNNRKLIFERVKKLIRASNNVIVTMHRVDVPKSYFDRETINRLLSVHFVKALKQFRRENYFAHLYPMVAYEVKKHNRKARANIVVHTKRDAKNIRLIFKVPYVYDFPLSFLNKHERERKRSLEQSAAFKKRYGLKQEDIAIGIFGFVTVYKGHETALHALKYLPEKYKLLVFGSQHPSSIVMNCPVDKFEEQLLRMIDKLKLEGRVLFCGNLNDMQFIDALYCCDFSVLPYLEVNQSGSGIASLAIETGIPSLFSNNKAFAELQRYFPNCFCQFDIGNYVELANKIENYHDSYTENRKKALEKYNIENNVRFYRKIFEGKVQKR